MGGLRLSSTIPNQWYLKEGGFSKLTAIKYGTAHTQVCTLAPREHCYSWRTLRVLITMFTHEQLPSLFLPTTCVYKHLWSPLRKGSLHESLNDYPRVHNNRHESVAFILFPDVFIVVCQVLNHWTMIATIFPLSLWNYLISVFYDPYA